MIQVQKSSIETCSYLNPLVSVCLIDVLYCECRRNLDKVFSGGSQFGANQQLYDLYQR